LNVKAAIRVLFLKRKTPMKLDEIIHRLNHRLNEARTFQDRVAKRIKKLDQDLNRLKAQNSDRKKKR